MLMASSAHQSLAKCHGKGWYRHRQLREGIESRKQGDFILFLSQSACKVSFYVNCSKECNQQWKKTVALTIALNFMLNKVKSVSFSVE